MPRVAVRQLHEFGGVSMDTLVHVQIVSAHDRIELEAGVQRALAWFDTVERICTRFDPASEVMGLLGQVGRPVQVSTLLFQVLEFALQLAEATDGAFDPTIGARLEQLGYATNYRTGAVVRSQVDAAAGDFHDISLDRRRQTVMLRRPLVIDLNAVSKGLAIDLAARALSEVADDFYVEAGGDLYARGRNAAGQPWQVGIQHPRAEGLLARTLSVTGAAVCTSGNYERGEHVLDGRSREAVRDIASITVIAPTAMAADGLSTAAMVLGVEPGLEFLESQGADGLILTADGSQLTTRGFAA